MRKDDDAMRFSHKYRDIYLISHLNVGSLILAESIRSADQKKNRKSLIIFTNSDKHKNVSEYKRAKAIGCRLLGEDILDISIKFPSPKTVVRVVLINPDENINVDHALALTEKYRNKVPAEIYVFASSRESECLLDVADKGSGKGGIPPVMIRRVNIIRNQVYKYLLENSIYENAITILNEKIISILIVGMGDYGMEIMKAVLWCGQMAGYVLKVNVIDINPDAEKNFYYECPGIRQRGTLPQNGEDYYEIKFYSGTDVFSESFVKIVKELDETTIAFVALGNEKNNLEVSIRLRAIFAGMQIDSGRVPSHDRGAVQFPKIATVMYNSHKASMLKQNRLCNFKGQYYCIDCIGDDRDRYSYENIFASKLEEIALKAHLSWNDNESFNNFEYNRRASMASAIHKKYRDKYLCNDTELKMMVEHMRWNAYMRSTEGYSFGYIRDDLAMRHPAIIKYSLLPDENKEKDHNMNMADIDTSE